MQALLLLKKGFNWFKPLDEMIDKGIWQEATQASQNSQQMPCGWTETEPM